MLEVHSCGKAVNLLGWHAISTPPTLNTLWKRGDPPFLVFALQPPHVLIGNMQPALVFTRVSSFFKAIWVCYCRRAKKEIVSVTPHSLWIGKNKKLLVLLPISQRLMLKWRLEPDRRFCLDLITTRAFAARKSSTNFLNVFSTRKICVHERARAKTKLALLA